ncbi:hypothetical protein SBADM41S_06812 [Streptomyces badius]
MSAIRWAVVLCRMSVAGSLACGVERPQPRWSKDHPVAVQGSSTGGSRASGPDPGAAVDHEGRLAVRVAAHLPVHVVAVPDIQHPLSYGSIGGYRVWSGARCIPMPSLVSRPDSLRQRRSLDAVNAAPRVLAVIDDLLSAAAPGERGALWHLAEPGRELDANLVRLPSGAEVGEHQEDVLDVLLVALEGAGLRRPAARSWT